MQLSNPGVLQTVALRGSLELFAMTSMEQLRAKSLLLTGAVVLRAVATLATQEKERNWCKKTQRSSTCCFHHVISSALTTGYLEILMDELLNLPGQAKCVLARR